MSIARVPFLPGVVDTSDLTYTVTGTSITGFTSSGVAHICAAVPTVRNLLRFCQNGFKLDTKPSSSYAAESTYDSSGKRSYKSLQDNKDNSSYSGKTIGTVHQRSRGLSRNTKDPFHLSSIMDAGDDGRLMELRTVQPPTHKDTQPNEGRDEQQVRISWTQRVEEQPPIIGREFPEQDLDDSASNKAILHTDSYP